MKSTPSVSPSDFGDFGTFLKYLRRRAQLTQTELALACGYSTPHISRLETNQRSPDHAALLALFVPALGLENEPELVTRLLELAGAQFAAAPPINQTRLINSPPLDMRSTQFRDRASEQAKIIEWLLERRRVISIYGRAGVGKTALACQVLTKIQELPADQRPKGIVYLGAGVNSATGISLDRVLSDFSKLLDAEARIAAEQIWRNPSATDQQRIAILMESLQAGHYILLLDNLETYQHPQTHEFTDPSLKAFFDVVLSRGGALSVLLTSRYPLLLPNHLRGYEQRLPLEAGLPQEDAIALIRYLDDEKTALPKEDSDPTLVNVIETTGAFPRALEALIGYLKGGSLRTLNDLISNKSLMKDEVTHFVVQEAIYHLAPAVVRILEALALLRRPVALEVVAFLLAPYLEDGELSAVMEELVSSCFVRYNHATRMFTLHPIDQEYCFGRIPAGSADDLSVVFEKYQPMEADLASLPYTRYSLNYRAALYFQSQRKPQSEWKSLDDLAPQLAEFEYRVRAEDYDTAARLLLTIDFDYLMRWGNWHTMLSLHKALENKVRDRQLQARCLWNLGRVCYLLGRMEEAIEYYEQGLEIACTIGDVQSEAQILGSLGGAYSDTGDEPLAITCYEISLTIAVENQNRQAEKHALHALADAHLSLGRVDEALGCFEQGLVICREMHNQRSAAYALVGLGRGYRLMGLFAQATQHYEQGLTLYRKVGDRLGEGFTLISLGETCIITSAYPAALDHFNTCQAIFEKIDYGFGRHFVGSNIAKVHFYSGELGKARLVAEKTFQYDMPKNMPKLTVIYGCILVALDEGEKARAAFESCINYATAFLTKSPQNYAMHYYRSLAKAGLVLLGRETINHVMQDYQAALDTFAGPGTVQDHLQLLENLIKHSDSEILQPVQDTLIKALED